MLRILAFSILVSLLSSPFLLADGTGVIEGNPDTVFDLEPIPGAPGSMILDEARLFQDREKEQLSAKMIDFRQKTGVSVYVVASSVLLGEKIEERALRIKNQWLAEKSGVIVAYERGSERLTFSATANPEGFVKTTDLETLFSAAYEQASRHNRGSTRVITAVDYLMLALPKAISDQKMAAASTSKATRKFAGWALAILASLAIVGIVATHLLRGREIQITESYTFPRFEIQERFGAPYSGGHHAEIQF